MVSETKAGTGGDAGQIKLACLRDLITRVYTDATWTVSSSFTGSWALGEHL